MTVSQTSSQSENASDAYLEAVRKVLDESTSEPETDNVSETKTDREKRGGGAAHVPPSSVAMSASENADEATGGAKEPSKMGILVHAVGAWCLHQIKSYRPERRKILFTSLVLMLLLKPFFVIGWTAFAAIALILCIVFLGADRFWRGVIASYGKFAKRRPKAARELKLRAHVIAKRWNRLLRWVPAGLADQLRAPDLREIVAADARHEVALDQRLDRINNDFSAG